MIQLPALPYAYDALEPIIDARTVEIHYSKHHQGYANKLNELLEKTPSNVEGVGGVILETFIQTTQPGPIFNNAAQIWNHTFYWNSLRSVQDNNLPTGALGEAITAQRGSFDAFKQAFIASGISNFGSGRTRLVKTPENTLEIINTSNAQTPLTTDKKALFTIDVREHAYYLHYQNRRPEYLENIRSLINWEYAEANYR